MNAMNVVFGSDASDGGPLDRMLDCAQCAIPDAMSGLNPSGPAVVSAELIHWKDRPQSWGGTWPGNHILCVINDFSSIPGALETLNQKHRKIWLQVAHSAYYLPARYRKKYVRMLRKDAVERLVSTLTDCDIKMLEAEMSMDDLHWWHEAMSGAASDMFLEAILNPSAEYPIKARVIGLQNVEYTKVYRNMDAAKAALQALREKSTWENLSALGFQFLS